MLLTPNNDPTEKFSSRHVSLLRDECDDIKTYRECGWFCVLGYKGEKRLVHAHCNSEEDYEIAMGMLRKSNPWNSYGGDGNVGYLVKATATYSVDGLVKEEVDAFFSSENPYANRERMVEMAGEIFREAAADETRSVRYRREYWDMLPRKMEVVSVDAEQGSRLRY
jgi:hypothetical protein